MRLDFLERAVPTLHSRAESWECDLNGHWNTRFYVRAFQNAAEAAGSGGVGAPGRTFHFRFHSEMFAGDALVIRSARSDEGAGIHVMTCGRRVVATALETPGPTNDHLPLVATADLGLVLPRGVSRPPVLSGFDGADAIHESGPVRPTELDHRNQMLPDEILRRCGTISHVILSDMGFDADFIRRTRIGRMLVEMRTAILAVCPVGSVLRVASRGPHFAGKTFATSHSLLSREGTLLAVVDFCMVTVDLNTRKAVAVPDFRNAAESAANEIPA